MRNHTGGCLCGAVKYTVLGKLRDVIACHCSQCRRQTGLYYAATDASDKMLEIRDSDSLKWYHSSPTAKRGFCANCGSVLFWKRNDGDTTSILAGSLDLPTGLKIVRHIYVADKGDFYEITDGLPQID